MTLKVESELPHRHDRPSPNQAWLRALERTARIGTEPRRILPVVVQELAQQRPDAPALLGQDQALSFSELAQAANRYARWAVAQHIGVGDCVCLLMPNKPEYFAIWLGITSVGGTVALLNTSLSGASLAHCVNVARPRHAIVDAALGATLSAALPAIERNIECWVHGAGGGPFTRLDRLVSGYCGSPLSGPELRPITTNERALYIYTSGTTGLPKAANVSHQRLMHVEPLVRGPDRRAPQRPHVQLSADVP